MQSERAVSFRASEAKVAQEALTDLIRRFGQSPPDGADVIVALGGDGFMLDTLKDVQPWDKPVYGMHRGTVGFLMNEFSIDDLPKRLLEAEEAEINPLHMRAETAGGNVEEALAINEVSLLREGSQAARLQISVDGKPRLKELVCDGAMVSTPAGSTAYNYSAHGPILPIGSQVLALTAVAPFRPRRWRGALLPKTATVRFDVMNPAKRPVMADADGRPVRNVTAVEVRSEPGVRHRILFDPGHGLEERLIREQFV